MIRPALVLALLLSAAVMMRGLASDWKKTPLPPVDNAAKKEAPIAAMAPVASSPVKGLQPVVPATLPDLKTGYLFNPERMLAGAEAVPPADDTEAAGDELLPAIAASIGEVTYTGSIIADAFSRAIIVYPAAPKAAAVAQPASRSSRSKPPSTAGGAEEHAQLEVGDMLDGYAVAEILPDKLVFTKGDETVEKLLHDPDKKRQAPAPMPAAPPPPGGGPPRPQQAAMGGGAASPRGVLSTTIGGSATPTTQTAPTIPGTAATPVPPAPEGGSPPVPSPVTASSSVPPSGAAIAPHGSQPPPVRRMVISREPSAPPDTSRVLRQSRDIDTMMPTPPMPGGN